MQMTEFRNMPYARPDLEAYGEQMRQTAKTLREAKTYAEARKAYFELQQAEEEGETVMLNAGAETIGMRPPKASKGRSRA